MLCDTISLSSEADYSQVIDDTKSAIDFVCNELVKVGVSLNQEASYVLNLDKNMRPIRCRILSLGTQDKVYLSPGEIYKIALKDRASFVMLFHNHPGGNTLASQDDIDVTNKIVEAGYLLNIPLLDHIIITDKYVLYNEFFSFRERGMLTIKEYMKKFENEEIDINNIRFRNYEQKGGR